MHTHMLETRRQHRIPQQTCRSYKIVDCNAKKTGSIRRKRPVRGCSSRPCASSRAAWTPSQGSVEDKKLVTEERVDGATRREALGSPPRRRNGTHLRGLRPGASALDMVLSRHKLGITQRAVGQLLAMASFFARAAHIRRGPVVHLQAPKLCKAAFTSWIRALEALPLA